MPQELCPHCGEPVLPGIEHINQEWEGEKHCSRLNVAVNSRWKQGLGYVPDPQREFVETKGELPEGYECWVSADGKAIQFTDPDGRVLSESPLFKFDESEERNFALRGNRVRLE